MNLQLARLFQQLARSAPLLAAAALFAQAPVSPNHVAFYTEPNFKGEVLIVEAGAAVPNLDTMRRSNQAPWMYAISSMRVEGTARATLHSGPNFSGQRIDLTTSVSDLYAIQRGNETGATWDRAIASVAVTGPQPQPVVVAQPMPPVRVEPVRPPPPTVVVVQNPPPPPPRPRYDRHSAELVVQRAFREVLARPADPEGLRTYRDRLMHEGWSEQQMIEHLQRSSEARGINADVAINKAYREVLGRDADASGLAHYRSKWKDGWTQGQIRDDLRRSHEGRDARIRDAVTRAYRELLGREPDASGLATYERLMRERGYSDRDIRQAIMSGDEYKQRNAKSRGR
ncbi:MAG TPA: hypothetical protein VM029_06945 [Opitutaceae bacterium]|nr:hypothetical protein [Opitutaceae bacterium]